MFVPASLLGSQVDSRDRLVVNSDRLNLIAPTPQHTEKKAHVHRSDVVREFTWRCACSGCLSPVGQSAAPRRTGRTGRRTRTGQPYTSSWLFSPKHQSAPPLSLH